MFWGVIRRRDLPTGDLEIHVSTRGSWRQWSMLELFTPELESHMVRIGLHERHRRGYDRELYVEARATKSGAWERATWSPGDPAPAWTGERDTDPPFSTTDD